MTVSPDNSYIVTSSYGATRLWHSQTGQLLYTLIGNGWHCPVTISLDSKYIVTSSHKNKINIWDSQTGQLLHTLPGHNINITSIAISTDNKYIVTGDYVGKVKVWNTRYLFATPTLSELLAFIKNKTDQQ